MSAEEVDVAATTAAAPPVADANGTEPPKSAESATAATRPGEDTDLPQKVQSRFDELTRRRYDAERRAEAAEHRALMAEQRAQSRPEPSSEVTPAASKTLADFSYDEAKYQAYLFGEARRESVKAAREELTKEQQAAQAQQRDTEFADREEGFSKELPDYFEVTRNPSLPISNAMAEAIKDSENGSALLYHLGKNVQVAAKIARLPPLAAARELGRIEAKLAEAPKPPQVSKAPPPAPKIAAADAKVQKDPSEMTDVEFRKYRERQIAQRRGFT